MKRTDLEIPEGWYVIDDDEEIKQDDKILYGPGHSILVTKGEYIGVPQRKLNGTVIRKRKLASTWIRSLTLLPTEEDGYVQVWGLNQAPNHARWCDVKGRYEYWRRVDPLPLPPDIVIKTAMKDEVVQFYKDGSIKVGCTRIDPELYEQIHQRRKETMKV